MTDRPQEPPVDGPADRTDDTRPVAAQDPVEQTQREPHTQQPATFPAPPRRGLRDRVWSLRAVIAIALASVILGGLAGAALATVSHHGDDGRFGPGHGRFGPGGPGPGGPGGGPGFGRGNGQGNGLGHGQMPKQMREQMKERLKLRREWLKQQRQQSVPSPSATPSG